MERRQIKLADRVEHRPRQMPLRHPNHAPTAASETPAHYHRR
jgi:hypothetical protein